MLRTLTSIILIAAFMVPRPLVVFALEQQSQCIACDVSEVEGLANQLRDLNKKLQAEAGDMKIAHQYAETYEKLLLALDLMKGGEHFDRTLCLTLLGIE